MNSLPDVYLVSVSKAVEFARNPRAVTGTQAVPPQRPEPEMPGDEDTQKRLVSRAAFDKCQNMPERNCSPHLCQLRKQITNEERWMTVCTECPAVYPWLNNPFGEVIVDETEDK